MVNPEKMGAEATKQPHTTTKSSEGKAKSKSDSSKTTDNEKITKERIALAGTRRVWKKLFIWTLREISRTNQKKPWRRRR